MDVNFSKLYKIDVENNSVSLEQFHENDNLNLYVMDLLQKVTDEIGDREYKFQEGARTIQGALTKIIKEEEIDDACQLIAKRLLQEETTAQERYGHLHDIQKGMLIISYVKMTEIESKIIISKADYNTFLEEISGDIKSGLPLKKKIFKSFIANVANGLISKIVTYDVNAKVSKYWWKEFLELSVVVKDEENTIRAFNAIEKSVLEPLKKKSKSDYLHLWNATVAYFRGEGEFLLSHYRDSILGVYAPYDEDVKIEELKKKCNELPAKFEFDHRFEKTPKSVNKRFKKTIELSNAIDLVIKHDIANLSSTFKPKIEGGRKYIMIWSEEGYEYAQKQQEME